MEIWKDIPGYEGMYQISSEGRVKSLEHYAKNGVGRRKVRERILKTYLAGSGRLYRYIKLHKDNVVETFLIHRLVGEAFIPNPDNKPCIDHIIPVSEGGGDNVDNLRWVTNEENMANEITKEHLINNPKVSTKVYRYSLDDVFEKEYPSLHEAGREGYGRKEIKKCCLGIRKQHKGHKWSYEPPQPLSA